MRYPQTQSIIDEPTSKPIANKVFQAIKYTTSLIILTVALIGCGRQPVISSNYPVPVIEPLPYIAGIYISPEFKNYIYENDEDKLNLDLGSKQTTLYEQIFSVMFREVRILDNLTAQNLDPSMDLIIEPALQEYAFLSPLETATNFYAVSLKYQIRLYSDTGELIGYWPFVAYGKDRKSFGSGKKALGEATTNALRDAAAAMSSQFHDVVENARWKNPENLNVQ